MAGSTTSTPPYHPTSKPCKPSISSSFLPWRKPNIYTLPLVFFLCIASYSLGLWLHGGSAMSAARNSNPQLKAPCSAVVVTATNSVQPNLDFSSHHSLEHRGGSETRNETGKTFLRCDARYSEYTPCEDAKRSLRFSRERLIYRERHCPEKEEERLKCRVPAPIGYKNPFAWPASRDLAWYANVPHKELTVEKAVQNWIRYEEDRFRFPGGGTMFPNGADAYIDDIGRLIDLRDGSIRTAIDTGCGVCH